MGQAPAARLLDQRRGLAEELDPPAAHGDPPSESPELRGDGLTDAGAGSGDHGDTVVLWVDLAHHTLLRRFVAKA